MINMESPWVKFRNPILKPLLRDKHGLESSVHHANAYFDNTYALLMNITCDIKL